MKINLLKINGFGKLKNKEINLNNNINIIYGKNEHGKTTTLKFLNSMFYGASKKKNGNDISDFEKYKPWDNGEYSGKITYTLDNSEQFEVYREFNKKNPKIFNSKLEDISNNFNIDKNKGILFFEDQTGIDENLFSSSMLIEQKEIILDQADRRNIIQKITNIFTSGEENISYKKVIEKLNKKYLEEVGTDRTIDKPINKINNKKEEICDKIKNIEINEKNRINIENKIIEINSEINNIENKKILLNKIKEIKEKINNKKEEIKIKNNLIEENKNKIISLENNYEKNNIKNSKKNIKKIILFILLILFCEVFNLLLKINIKNKIIISVIFLLILISFFIYNSIFKNKKIKSEKNNINNEKNIINKIINELEENINNINYEIKKEELNEKNNIINRYNKINIKIQEIEELFNNNLEEINNIIINNDEKINNLNFQKYKLEIEEKNISNIIEEKINLEEQLEYVKEEEKAILDNGEAIKLSKEILEKAYNKMKNNITPEFKNNLINNNIEIIGEKYKNIVFNEEEGLKVELENGNNVNANLLSVGTIDQLYLALRLATVQAFSKETMPIILDETFAYYDDERLENIIRFLNDDFKNNQIIIFTCSNREKEILDKLQINYNFIEL